MTVKMKVLDSHEDWLKARTGIGGSDASAIIGMNPWKTNVELWLEKTGQSTPEDISDKPFVKYGTQAETHLRGLFRLDFPQYHVEYVENNMFINDKFPWAHASLDGWLYEKGETITSIFNRERLGILEIKTTEILQSMQKEKWNNQLPQNYYCQLLHYMAVCEADFAVLKAQLKAVFDGVPYLQTKHYHIERKDVLEDIEYLMEEEKKFWHQVQTKHRPDLILPNI